MIGQPKPFEKPRYTAAHFKKLHRYPVRTCAHCGQRFGPKITPKGTLEQIQSFRIRRACSNVCKAALISSGNRRAWDKKGASPAPVAATAPIIVPEPPVPPPAPENVAEEVKSDKQPEPKRLQLESGRAELDKPLMLALFQAFAAHEEEHFLSVFEDRHPELVKAYRLWQGLNPVLRERLAA